MKVCMVMCMIMAGLFGSTAHKVVPDRSWMIVTHDANQVKMSISNYGKFGQSESGGAGCWWPKSTDHNYIFGAGFWFGTIDSITGDTLVTIGYSPHGGEFECGPGLAGWDPDDPNAIIYTYPENWPPPANYFPMAPQGSVSHDDSWCCYNDCDSVYHMPGDTRPIGIEVYQTAYVWIPPEVDNIFYLTIEIMNVSGHKLKNCIIGITTDCDLGSNAGNDLCSGIINQCYSIAGNIYRADNLGYQWNDNESDSTWGTIGFDLLQTPFDLEIGMDKDQDTIPDQFERDCTYYCNNVPVYRWDVDHDSVPDWRDAPQNPQYGMTAFKIFNLNLEPNRDPDRYLTMAGYNYQTGAYEPYDTISTPDDQRFILASGRFDLEANKTVTLVLAVFFSKWYPYYQTPDTALVLANKWAQLLYDRHWRFLGIEEDKEGHKTILDLIAAPNPAHGYTDVSYTVPEAGDVSLILYNLIGQAVKKIYHGNQSSGKYDFSLDARDLPQGMYFLVLRSNNTRTAKSVVIIN